MIVDSDAAGIARCVATLRNGGLVGLPTETVYGLGADATNDDAVRRIFFVKGRPATHPLILHVASVDAALAAVPELPAAVDGLPGVPASEAAPATDAAIDGADELDPWGAPGDDVDPLA